MCLEKLIFSKVVVHCLGVDTLFGPECEGDYYLICAAELLDELNNQQVGDTACNSTIGPLQAVDMVYKNRFAKLLSGYIVL